MGSDREGNYKKKNEVAIPSYGNSTMRLRCPFRLRSVPSGIGWKVVVKCGMHNHRLDKDLVGHDILGRLKDDERKFVNDMTKYNMAPRYIVSALKDKDPRNITSTTQIYRVRATYRLGKRGALTKMQMLLSLIHQEKYMCWSRNKESSDIVADIFWTHPNSVKLLNMFPLVLIFDCTYKTNRYRLPLLEIVGVTSAKLTFSVAFAYLEYEREENLTWALDKLNELFYYEKLLPDVMVTDRELALMNAIDSVYLNVSHLLCTFHISKNVSMKFKEYVKSERQEHVMDQWNNMMYSNTKDEDIMDLWNNMMH
ncbi:protein FAR1-RELATED SEQUENCE 5-like [Vicia villosa]|uniref:protein FAR1-RELATED SEQUENCE 5-like n=1 Tax=Vicia villosa TaxID=3911 RepID=UPI00273C983C|nr:protein FAR1-RELATED SEQUENCE 5-like [Vicia villosa]